MNTDQFEEGITKFITTLDATLGAVTVLRVPGRRFDRVSVLTKGAPLGDVSQRFFVERATGIIYGAKSSFQFNPRRVYGSLQHVDDMDWNTLTPRAGTPLSADLAAREASIQKTYKPRGRPKKALKLVKGKK